MSCGHRGAITAASAQDFSSAAADLGVKVSLDEPLARHTTFRIGGLADLFAEATTTAQLAALVALAAEQGIPTTVLGGGSNVLVSDAGVRGLVIANRTRQLEIRLGMPGPDGQHGAEGQPYLVADSGVPLAGLARWAIRKGWAGLEWAVSVPGTVGGAVIGNAGAHGGDMAGNVAWTQVVSPDLGRQVLTATALAFAYRSSALKTHGVSGDAQTGGLVQTARTPLGSRPVILTVGLYAVPGETTEMAARAERFLARRRTTQPVEPSAGSIFRNPRDDYAGRLVEAAGLKGQRIGGAQISPRHANFIVNTGQATAADVVALMNLMRSRVHQLTGIVLIPEISFLGDWTAHPLCIL